MKFIELLELCTNELALVFFFGMTIGGMLLLLIIVLTANLL